MINNQYKFSDLRFESRPVEKGLGIMVDEKLELSPQ